LSKKSVESLSIEALKSVSSRTKEKLKLAGLFLLKDVLIFHPIRLAEIAGFSVETAEKVVEEAIKIIEEHDKKIFGLERASKILVEKKERKFLHTGSKNLDEILGGGYAAGEVTELAGEYRTGKSQACYTAMATAFLPIEEGGLNDGKIGIVLIDSENTFIPSRLEPIFKRFGIEPKEALDMIFVGRPKNAYHQMRMINELVKVLKENNIKLIIVDSLTKLPRADFTGRGELYERQRLILSMIESLRRLVETYDIVGLVTNQVVAMPDVFFGRPIKPIGGHVLAHNVDTRLFLSFVKENIRSIEILDSSRLPPAKTRIQITEAGITDPEK